MGDYKLLWSSRTNKTDWYDPDEEIVNPLACEQIKNQRSRAGLPNFVRGFPATPRGMDTMDILELNRDEVVEYWDEGSEEIDEEEWHRWNC